MTPQEKVLSVARGEWGVKENPPGSNKVKYNTWFYGREVSGSAYPWCCAFVCWVFNQAGLPNLVQRTASCTTMLNWFKRKGQNIPVKDVKPGDVVFYQFDKDSHADHIGIAERVTDTGVYAFEGNTSITSNDNGGSVMRRLRKWNRIMAVARPDYGSAKADVKDEVSSQAYATLKDVPVWYQPSIRKLLEKGALVGCDEKDHSTIEDNVINVTEDYCRVMTTLDRLGLFNR